MRETPEKEDTRGPLPGGVLIIILPRRKFDFRPFGKLVENRVLVGLSALLTSVRDAAKVSSGPILPLIAIGEARQI